MTNRTPPATTGEPPAPSPDTSPPFDGGQPITRPEPPSANRLQKLRRPFAAVDFDVLQAAVAADCRRAIGPCEVRFTGLEIGAYEARITAIRAGALLGFNFVFHPLHHAPDELAGYVAHVLTKEMREVIEWAETGTKDTPLRK